MDRPRIRPWSTVVRILTDNGAVWFKANHAQTTYEAGLVRELVRQAPELVLGPIATEVEQGWMLLPDGGPILRSYPDDAVLGHWERLLPEYAELQQALSARTNDLITMGVPDDRPESMPRLLTTLLDRTEVLLVDEPEGLSADEFDRLRELSPALAARCAILASSGIAASVDHGDLHDGNVFVRAGGYAVFDWGDTSVAHPFCSLLVTMSAIRARYDLAPNATALARLRDAYLEPWTGGHTRSELIELATVATAVAPLNRARSWERALNAVPAAERGDYRDAVPGWLRELLPQPSP
ncbi:MAG TPA: phosphotransferase [Jiangellaceae bacterium]